VAGDPLLVALPICAGFLFAPVELRPRLPNVTYEHLRAKRERKRKQKELEKRRKRSFRGKSPK
jgi:hypothetical protein